MDTEPSEKSQKSVSARRRLFQILAVGGTAAVVLPAKWVKPVVDAVIVPAHAAGSVVGRVGGIYGNGGVQTTQNTNSASALDRFAGMIIGSAHAAVLPLTCGSLTDPNSVCISFSIPSAPGTNVTVVTSNQGSSSVPQIYPNNTIDNVSVGNLSFTGLTYTPGLNVSGNVSSPSCNNISQPFVFTSQLFVCQVSPD